MSLNLYILRVFFLIIGVSVYLFLNVLIAELKSGIRQLSEDTLIDMPNLLAELVADEFAAGEVQQQNFPVVCSTFYNVPIGPKFFQLKSNAVIFDCISPMTEE